MDLLDGTVEAAQAFADKVMKSSCFQKNGTPSWMGQHHVRRGGYLPSSDDAVPRKAIVSAGTTGMHAAWASNWVIEHRGRHYPEMKLGRGGDRPSIADPWVILHEIAHLGVHPDKAWHGREFAKLFLTLIKRFLGPEAARTLRQEYSNNRVKYRTPPNLSDEERARRAAAFKERMAQHELVGYRAQLLERYGIDEEES